MKTCSGCTGTYSGDTFSFAWPGQPITRTAVVTVVDFCSERCRRAWRRTLGLHPRSWDIGNVETLRAAWNELRDSGKRLNELYRGCERRRRRLARHPEEEPAYRQALADKTAAAKRAGSLRRQLLLLERGPRAWQERRASPSGFRREVA